MISIFFVRSFSFSLLLLAATELAVLSAGATTIPFIENFDADVANWVNFNSIAPLTFNASGGPDGSSYASGEFNFKDLAFGNQGPVILRASTSPLGAASGGNFFGDWIADGVTKFSAQVRHNASVPLTFYSRFASPFNFPGATAIQFAPVLPNTWTEIEVEIANDSFVTFEGQTFADVFDGVGNIQFSVSVPQAFAGVDQDFAFDVDQVSIVPEPSAFAMLSMAVLTGLRRRRV